MSITISRRAGIACFALLALVILAVPVVRYAAAESSQLEACVNPGNGMMRLVDAGTACHQNETRVEWNVTGPQGPAGPQGPVGPQGPAGSSGGGPPYVWICTPASFPATGGNPRFDVYVFNGGSSTANVSVNILDTNGANLLGHTIPGTNPAQVYPGQADGATVNVLPAHTLDVHWAAPGTSPPDSADGVTDVSFAVRVTSDQPAVVGHDFHFGDFVSIPCSLLPK